MEALELILNLLEKVSVLVSTALVFVLLRPAEVWLTETGRYASFRRRAFILAVFCPLSIWGIYLGFEIGGVAFNTRAVGIIVAGFLGGRLVGSLVGAVAGAAYAAIAPEGMAAYVFSASVLDGLFAGFVARRWGTSLEPVVLGAIGAQLFHHVFLGAIFTALDPFEGLRLASNVTLHAAKIGANTIGVLLFLGLLNLTLDLETARRDARDSKDQARSARLEALQYQLQPHFLFNLLNTLAYLIRTDPVRARSLTLDLSDFLRYTLARTDEETSLRDELTQIERYIELERARFGDGLVYDVHSPPGELTSTLRVPPMILQPLVENAIRHGARDGQVHVSIEISVDGDARAHVRVLDDGPGPPADAKAGAPPARRSGVGLQNVRDRIERYYRGRASLELSARPEGGACAALTIPLDPAHAA